MIDFVRTNLNFNTTELISEDETGLEEQQIASSYFIEQGLALEMDYRQFRMELPVYLEGMADHLQAIEDDLCGQLELVNLTIKNCTTVYGGMVNLGYTNFISLLLQHFRKVDI
eukprot:CAMPEP_0202962368 /NCGR_PEP_ID=MMETSP1396-20130829/6470_1 /ASSEMBLY_ACC=CAM_ASM_000872 /TAXON_ID= /ORGANISM="Pseudokeronopsis sp., Strain Brazil" /LENGTH=112 /DNA_ID=CAMNT_0049682901 /DNA_START=1906 /DNA_END=2244 /DNA_ORIENTATION=-